MNALGISLSAQVNAEFTQNNTSGCSPLVVMFTDQSTGNPTTWRWDFGNGNGSIQQNPSAIYMVPGQYTVRLIATGASGIDTVIKTQLITVFEDPQARFIANRTSGCIPATINFEDRSLPGDAAINYWLWDFGDGTTSTLQNPTHTYTNPGIYSVTLLVRDANGCRNEFTRTSYITIMPQVDAAFTGSPVNGCTIPHTVNFNNTTTGGSGFTYQWTFGDGSTSTQLNPSHTYTAGGNYTVRLIATNSAGCSDTITRNNYVSINNIVANFTTNRTTACVGQNITFTSNAPGAVGWNWNFGDGGTSTSENPTRSYSTAGTYTVTLIARNSNNCRDTVVRTALITITPRPVANFTGTPVNGCQVPHTVNFTNTTTDGVSWVWTFGDGGTSTAQNPSHTYTSPGTYTVRLVATGANGCTHTRTRTDYINITLPTVAFTANVREGCIPLTVNFTDQSSANSAITGWQWSFGDGGTSTVRNPTHVYTTTGRFDVTLTITTANGCTRTITYPQYIRAGEQPTIEFTATPRQTCLFFPVSFTDQSSPADFWFWQFGDGGTSLDQNPVYQYGDTGLFTVTLIVGVNGCYDTLIKPDYIRIFPPRASFTTLYNCIDPYTVSFTNTSLGGHVWLWRFGDGTTASTQNATHTYATRGDYTVTLVTWDTIGGCLDSTQALIQVRDPLAAFTANDTVGCVDHVVTFTNSATDAFSYNWDFGNGQTSTNANPTVTYSTPGVYTVQLIVRDIHNCADTFIRPNYITALGATALFNADTLTGCTPLIVQYQDLSTSFLGNIVAWNWNLGNGQTSTLQNPSGNYTIPGDYTITLTVTDDNGCSSTLSRVNFIQPTYPTPAFYSDDTLVCLGGPVNFVNTSIGNGMTYQWNFGDGGTSSDANPTHTFADTGRYTITLNVRDINNCDSTTVRNQYIHVVRPTPLFVADTLDANCPPLLVNFFNQSSADVTGWLYDFGDGQTSNLPNPSHIYVTPGVYYPTLTITNNIGCTETYNLPDSIVVRGPTGSFIYNQITFCAPFEVDFYAQGTNPAVTHIWDFGDGNVAVDDDTTTHYYAIAGTFNPQLILDDMMGCVISLPTISPIYAAIVNANFTSDVRYMCRPGVANFTDLSSGTPGIVAWDWNFGDGNTSTDQNPSHYYAATGSYDVTLIATNADGCRDTMFRPGYIRVMDDPTALFTVNTQNACFPATINFTNQSTADTTIASILWVFDDGTTSTLQNPTKNYANPGTYDVQLIVTTVMGCIDTFEMPITLFVPPAAAAGTDAAICIGQSTTLTGTGGVSYLWSPATGLSATNIASPSANPTVTTNYILLVTDGNGCQDRDTLTVTVNPLPTPIATGGTICVNGSTQLNATGGVGYAWDNMATLSNPAIANPNANPLATTTYTVTVTDGNGCINTAQAVVNVNPLPTVTTSPDASICIGFSSLLNATGGVSYSWSPAATLSAANIANPVATPTVTTTYNVTVTDANGCINTGSTTITVNPLPVVVMSPAAAICIGQSSQLSATGGVSYIWSPAGSLDNATLSNPTATPTATTTYSVTVTDANGCINTGSTIITVNPLPVVTTIGGTICINGSTQLNATGGIGYVWDNASTLSNPAIANPNANPLSTTTYTVTVTDANGCVNTAQAIVNVNPLPTVTTSPDASICIGFSSQLNAAGGVSYVWSPAATLDNANIANPTATPTVTTTYNVTVTDANGCINTGSTTITVNPLPVVVMSPAAAICIGQSSQLNATGGVSYIWSPAGSLNDATLSNPTASPAATTTYSVTVTDANGCINTGSTVITVNPLPVINTTGGTICINGSTQLNATGGVGYAWSPAATLSNPAIANPNANPLSTTTYTVTVTDGNGCVNTAQAIVNVNPLPTVTTSPDASICIGFSSQLSATGGVTYAWSPAATLSAANIANPTATPTVTTTYNVTVTDANGCINTGSTTITVNPLPVVVMSPAAAICIGQNSQLSATGGVSYIWSPAGSLDNATLSNPTATPTSTTTYSVTVTDANGCINTGSTIITVNPLPTVITTGGTICINGNTQLNATGGVIYAWNNTVTLSNPAIANPSANPLTTTTYTVTVTDANGCVNTAQAIVNVNPLPTVTTSPDAAICIGFSSQLNATGGVAYAWSPAATLSAANIANPVATPTVTTTYNVTVTDANGCINKGSTTITVNPLPVVVMSPAAAICIGQSSQLSATGGVSFIWSPAGSLDNATLSNPTASPTATTTYSVTVTDANGCINTGSTTITVNSLPTITTTGGTICINGSTQLNATGGISYVWDNAATLSNPAIANPTANPLTTTTYTVTVTDGNGCVNTAQAIVNVNPLPTVTTSPDAAICIGFSSQLNASGGVTYAWSPAATLSAANIANPTATPTVTTTYNVTVTDVNGCINTGSTTITVNPLPVVVMSPAAAICIGQSSQLNATGGVSYIWSPAGSLDNATMSNPTASPTATTTYSVTVTDANGCINTGSTTITVNPLPVITITPDTLLCQGQNVQLLANGGAGAGYIWGPSAGLNCLNCANPTSTPTVNTEYTVTVTSIHGCIDSASVAVNLNAVDARFSTSDTTACAPTTIQFQDLSVADSTIVTWNWNFGDGNTSINQNPTHTYTTAGVYTARLQVITSTGCIDSTSLVLNINALPAVAAGPDRTICINDTTTLLGTGGVNYAWSPASTLSNANTASPQAFPLSTTTYQLTVTDANGCQGTSQVTVTVNSLPIVTTTPDQALCFGDSLQLDATGGVSYLWTPATGINCATCASPKVSPPFNPALSTTYMVLVTDSNGCVNTGSVTIGTTLLPVLDLSPDSTICAGDTVTLVGSQNGNNLQYQWSPNTNLACDNCPSTLAWPDTTTTYAVVTTGPSGCTNRGEITITVNQLPVVITTPDTAICHGETIELMASGGMNYAWTPSQGITCSNACNMIMAAPDSTTTYNVVVTDLNGCESSGAVEVVVHNIEAAFNLSDTSACTPQLVTLTDQSTSDNPIIIWIWDMDDAGVATTQNAAATYNTAGTKLISLVVVDSYGCIDSTMKPLEMLQTSIAVAGNDTAICFGETAQLQGSGGHNFTWSGDQTISDVSIANPTAKPITTTTYYLTTSLNNGCDAADTVIVTVHQLPVPSIMGDSVTCLGDSINLEASGGVTYLWSPAQGLSSTLLPNTTVAANQNITYTVRVTNSNGCSALDSIALTVNPTPLMVASPDAEICEGESVVLEASGALTYAWGPNQDISCLDCTTTTANPTQSITYMVAGFNEFGCGAVDTVRVTVRPLPAVETIADVTMCNGETLELTTTAIGATGFNWTANGMADTTLQSPTVSPTTTTTYIVEAYNQYGCTDQDTVMIKVIETILAQVSDGAIICEGQNVNLSIEILETGLSLYQVTWMPSELFPAPHNLSQTIFPETSMTVQVAIVGGECAVDTQSVNIVVNPLPTTDLGPNRTALMGEYVTLDANASAGVTEYYWYPNDSLDCDNCEQVRFNAFGSNTYTVTVTDDNGCMAMDTVSIRVLTTCEQDIFIPNSFSPNNDKSNDVLYIRSNEVEEIKIFRIFDRWGNLVFETSDIDQGWNGTYKAKMVDPGVFVYYLEGTCRNGGEVFLKGNVTVLR